MKIIEYKDSWVKFTDCIEGMKELPDKSIDLCLTDPPFNVEYKGKSFGGIIYNDDMEKMEYITWCKEWFEEVRRVTKTQLVFCGNPNMGYWCKYIEIPRDIAIWYKKNSMSRGSAFYLATYEAILLYGEFKNRLHTGVINENVLINQPFLHPCCGTVKLYKKILSQIQPSSVLDPFMGSGTTAEAAIQLGIPFYGFELMEEYAADINKRIDRSKYYKKPRKLDEFF